MDVLVAGGGVGGLATALALARGGHDVRLCERAPVLREGGAGIVLQPNGLAVLDALGVVAGLVDQGSVLSEATLFDEWGRVLTRVTIEAGSVASVPALVVTREALLRALADAVEKASVTVDLATEVAVDADGSVTVGRDGRTEAVEPDLVVGADGAASAIASSAGFDGRPFGRRRWYIRALAACPAPLDRIGEHWGDEGTAGVFPCGPEATYLYATATDRVRQALAAADLAAATSALTAAHPALTGLLASVCSTDEILLNQVGAQLVVRFVAGNVALVGDAAHPMAPNLGQGANSALVDAAVLAIALGASPDLSAALSAYEDERRRPVQRVQRAAEAMGALGHLKRGRSVRNLVLRTTPASLARRQARASQQCDPVDLALRLQALWPA